MGSSTLRVGGIFKPNVLLGSYVVGDRYFLAHFDNPLPVAVLLQTENGSSATSKAVDTGLSAYPNLKIQSKAAFKKSQEQQINQLLGLIYALLALAVLIALIGIVNTLMLSVFERTHEIGLLRAVGMKRRQLRAMIRSESVILAIFGAIIGIIVGTALGVVLRGVVETAGHHRHCDPGGQPGGVLDPRRPPRPRRSQLAGPPCRQTGRADGDR